jgi:hypothetical protein
LAVREIRLKNHLGRYRYHPTGIPDLRVLNTGFNNCDKPIIQVTRKSKFVKIDLNRKQNG